MPGATARKVAAPEVPRPWKASIIPQTVPNSPMNGVTAPVVASLARKAEAIRQAELDRFFHRCPELDKRQRSLVTGLSLRIVSKLLHPAITAIRDCPDDHVAETVERARLIDEIFALSELSTLAEE